MNFMPYTILFTGKDGRSCFKKGEEPLNPSHVGLASSCIPVKNIILGQSPVEDQDWHNTPVRMYIVVLSGVMQVEVSGGEMRDFNAGNILLAEDLTGKGHITRALNDEPVNYLAILL